VTDGLQALAPQNFRALIHVARSGCSLKQAAGWWATSLWSTQQCAFQFVAGYQMMRSQATVRQHGAAVSRRSCGIAGRNGSLQHGAQWIA
jgi:hypothetical protein